MTDCLLGSDDLPSGFEYPAQYRRFLDTGATSLEPWRFLGPPHLKRRQQGLANRYPTRALVPFAARQDNDDVACWEGGQGGRVFIVHDHANPGWERRGEFADFHTWLRAALEDYLAHDP